jgi:GT2 family glycosyltransferase
VAEVAIGWLHNGQVVGDFAKSLANLIAASRPFLYGQIVQAGSHITMGRTTVVRRFLETPADWLWMVDSDMTFEPDCLFQLLNAADPEERPIVGGLCFGLKDGVPFPTIFVVKDDETYNVRDWPDNTVMRVSATGAACLLVHRTVFETMALKHSGPLPWFKDEVLPSGLVRGEDITFCDRATRLGFPIFVHTGVKVGHVKQQIITEEQFTRG